MLDGPIHKGIFPYVRSLPPTPNFPIMIYPAQVVGRFSRSPIGFHARSPEYGLKRAHKRDSFLREVKVSKFPLLV